MTPDNLAKACCKLSCVVFLGHTAEVCGRSFWDGVQYGPSRQRSPAGHQIHVWFPGWASRQETDHWPGRTAHLEEQLVRYQALPVFDLIFCSICGLFWSPAGMPVQFHLFRECSTLSVSERLKNDVFYCDPRLTTITKMYLSFFLNQPSSAVLGQRDKKPSVCLWHPQEQYYRRLPVSGGSDLHGLLLDVWASPGQRLSVKQAPLC